MEIHRVQPDDWPLLRQTRLDALADAPSAFGSTYREERDLDEASWRDRAEKNAWFVAVDNGVGVGIVAGATFSPHPARDLVAMWVQGEVRGAGVAGALVGEVITWAVDDGAGALLLWVADGNDRARGFYERIGFVRTGNRKPLRSNPSVGQDEMRLDL